MRPSCRLLIVKNFTRQPWRLFTSAQVMQSTPPIFKWLREGKLMEMSSERLPESEFSARELAAAARSRPLEEILPVAASLLAQGRLEVVESLITTLTKQHMREWSQKPNASLPNQLMQEYLEKGDMVKAGKWKDWLWSRLNCPPDTMSYGILLKYLLSNLKDADVKEKEVKALVEQMPLDGVRLDQLFSLNFLSVPEKNYIKSTFHGKREVGELEKDWISLSDFDLTFNGNNNINSDYNENLRPSSLPEAVSIESKSNGISFLKDSLRILKNDPAGVDFYAIQERLEKDCYQATAAQLRTELEKYRASTKAVIPHRSMKHLLSTWQLDLTEHIKNTLKGASNLHENSEKRIMVGSGILYSSILETLEPQRIALVCLQEMIRSSSYDPNFHGVQVLRLSLNIANALEKEVFAQQISKRTFLEHAELSPRNLERVFQSRRIFDTFMRKQYAALERNVDAIRDGWIPKWSPKLKAEIGVFVISMAVDCLKFCDSKGAFIPAFGHRLRCVNSSQVGFVEAHPDVFKLFMMEQATGFVEPWAMPMLVPPRPWLTYSSGGYLTQRNLSVRIKDDPLHMSLIHQADKEGRMDKILLGLDILGRTPWIINEEVLSVALKLWNSGVNVATLESVDPESKSPKLGYKARETFESQEEFVKYVREAVEQKEVASKDHSTKCDTNYKLEIARQFSGLSFYLPHSVDFRGRAYPIPPHLSHVGSDFSRGLLKFSDGKPLGEKGLFWLKVQLSNMAGFDKASLDERAAYTDSHLQNIYDSADAPLTGKQWWRQADSPWQCLATCMEVAAALRSKNHEEYISHLPCQQDGSCNGLQHYAALGGDIDGARHVNLIPSDRPQDVYAAVAKLVNEQIEKDAFEVNHIAAKLKGKINRKIIKQPVMTNVYGVTKYGARQQIHDRLKEYNVVPPEYYNEARNYLAERVFASLGHLFDNAERIQKWLSETAVEIGRAVPLEVSKKFGSAIQVRGGEERVERKMNSRTRSTEEDPADRYPQTPVFWTTPLGFQVLQPYLKTKIVTLKTVLQSLNLRLSSKFDPVDVAKQASAFPPNFVHSLDATHMFLTATACAEAGLTFASVHDCFWTHASSVDSMNKLLREQFVALHSQPILERLRNEFVERYRDYVVPIDSNVPAGDIRHIEVKGWRPINIKPIPDRGDFDINNVLDSTYFFS